MYLLLVSTSIRRPIQCDHTAQFSVARRRVVRTASEKKTTSWLRAATVRSATTRSLQVAGSGVVGFSLLCADQ